MHVAKYILYDVARKVASFNITRKVDAVLREKSLLLVVPCNITFNQLLLSGRGKEGDGGPNKVLYGEAKR